MNNTRKYGSLNQTGCQRNVVIKKKSFHKTRRFKKKSTPLFCLFCAEFPLARISQRYECLRERPAQEVTSCWISVHRISRYQGYQPDIRGLSNGYEEKIDQTSFKQTLAEYKKYLLVTPFQIPVAFGQREINFWNSLKTAMFRSNPTAGYRGYQPDINAFSTPDIMSCHPSGMPVFWKFSTYSHGNCVYVLAFCLVFKINFSKPISKRNWP